MANIPSSSLEESSRPFPAKVLPEPGVLQNNAVFLTIYPFITYCIESNLCIAQMEK